MRDELEIFEEALREVLKALEEIRRREEQEQQMKIIKSNGEVIKAKKLN